MGVLGSPSQGTPPLPPPDRQTGTSENITLHRTTYLVGKNQHIELHKQCLSQVRTSYVVCWATGSWSPTSTTTTAFRSRPVTPRRTSTRRACRSPRWRSRSAGASSRTVRRRSQVNPHVSCVQILCHFFLLYILHT